MLHMSKVCDRLVNAILKNVEIFWFSSTGCSANIPLIVRIHMKMRIFYAVKLFNQSLTEQPRQKPNRKALKHNLSKYDRLICCTNITCVRIMWSVFLQLLSQVNCMTQLQTRRWDKNAYSRATYDVSTSVGWNIRLIA